MSDDDNKKQVEGLFFLPSALRDGDEVDEILDGMLAYKLKHPARSMVLVCDGNGGEADLGLKVAEFVRTLNTVTGVVFGTAQSSHATVFAGCSSRQMTQMGFIGVHQAAYPGWHQKALKPDMLAYAEDLRLTTARIATLFAQGSDWDREQWERKFEITASACTPLTAAELIKINFAQYLPSDWYTMLAVGETPADD